MKQLVSMSIRSPQLLITLDYLVMIFQIKWLWRNFLLLFLRGFNKNLLFSRIQRFKHYLIERVDECSPSTRTRKIYEAGKCHWRSILCVRYSSVSLSPTLGRNEKVEQHIRKKTRKPNVLRFWVEGGVILLYVWLISHC